MKSKIVVIVCLILIILVAALGCKIGTEPKTERIQKPASANAEAQVNKTENLEKTCNCTDEFEPVCYNNQLYQNKCVAECLGITDYVEGECHNPEGKTFYKCAPTSGGLSAQYNPVCAKIHRLDKDDYIWRTYPNSQTACRAGRPKDIEIIGYTRGECGT